MLDKNHSEWWAKIAKNAEQNFYNDQQILFKTISKNCSQCSAKVAHNVEQKLLKMLIKILRKDCSGCWVSCSRLRKKSAQDSQQNLNLLTISEE